MRFCADHWAQCRSAVEARGLTSLVSESGEEIVNKMISQLQGDVDTIDNFDPLMAVHWAIASNAMDRIADTYIQNPLILMAADPEHPEWECPICCLNWLALDHDKFCKKEGCDYPRGATWEWMIDRAADDAKAQWESMRP